jgi:hypothetical protein
VKRLGNTERRFMSDGIGARKEGTILIQIQLLKRVDMNPLSQGKHGIRLKPS